MIGKYFASPWPPGTVGMSEEEILGVAGEASELLSANLARAEQISAGFLNEAVAIPAVTTAIDQCLARLASTDVWGPTNRLPSGRLWELAGEHLQHGALLHRARFKPRGYAGDDVMLRQICENWRCEHPLGRLLDHYFQSHAAPKAVRNRTQIVADALVDMVRQPGDSTVRVSSIGSGPAMDITWACEVLSPAERNRVRVQLLDLDPQALAEAAARLEKWLPAANVTPRRENLYRLARLGEAAAIEADLIACTGFFDYLNDADAAALLGLLWRQLAPGGRLIVFNFSPDNGSRALMEWIGNWYLTYRDRSAMHDLAVSAGIPKELFAISAEAEGIDLFIDARKPPE